MIIQIKQAAYSAPLCFRQDFLIPNPATISAQISCNYNTHTPTQEAGYKEGPLVQKQAAQPVHYLTDFLQKLDASGANLRFAIQLASADGKSFEQCIAPSMNEAFANLYNSLPIGDDSTVSAYAAYKKKPIIVEAVRFAAIPAQWRKFYAEHDITACYCFPILTAERKLLGILSCYHNRTERIEVEMIDAITKATALAAIIIEKNQPQQQSAA